VDDVEQREVSEEVDIESGECMEGRQQVALYEQVCD